MVTSGVGGGADFVARLIAQGIASPLGQQVVAENRGGAGGVIPGEIVAKAPADGYTLLFYANTIWLAPFMRDRTPYDPLRDFSPITLAGSSPNMVVVHPLLPVKSIQDLIALARAKPGELNYGTSGNGSASHLAGELFKAMAGVNIVRINYKGAAPAFNDVVAGQVQITFGSAALVLPHLKSGRLRALAVTSARPSALFPGLPTVAASGLPGYETDALFGMFAPAKTPEAIVSRLNQEVMRFLKSPEARERLLNAGVEVAGTSPEGLTATMKADMARMGKVIQDAGIREE